MSTCYFLLSSTFIFFFFFFNDTATTEIYTLSLHDALPILADQRDALSYLLRLGGEQRDEEADGEDGWECSRSEEHTSELQSRLHLVCRLLLEKKKKQKRQMTIYAEERKNDRRVNYIQYAG